MLKLMEKKSEQNERCRTRRLGGRRSVSLGGSRCGAYFELQRGRQWAFHGFKLGNVAKILVIETCASPLNYPTAGRYSQEPVNGYDEGDVISRQSNRGQHDDHGDQTSLRNASCSNTSSSCSYTVQGNKQKKQHHSDKCVTNLL